MTSNIYLKFENPSIPGVSQVPEHTGEIEVLSWNHGFVQPTSPTRGPAGPDVVEPARHQNLSFTKYIDSATNDLLKYCWSGKQIGKATLTCCRDEGADHKPVEYLVVVMEHIIISNYSITGGPGDIPVENVSLDYGIIQYIYKPFKEGGAKGKTLSVKHDLETGMIE